MKTIKIISLLLFSILTLSTNLYSQKSNEKLSKKSFIYEAGNIKIEFPSKFSESKTVTKKGLEKITVKAKNEKEIFVLSYIIHKNVLNKKDIYEMADISINSAVNGLNGSLIKSKKIKVDKNKGKEAQIKINSNKFVYYRVIFAGKKQFQIFVISKQAKKTKTVKNFFKSLTLK